MKGISPIIASVLLIAITMSIAVILAGYVTSYTREQTGAIPTACIGGSLSFQGTPDISGSTLTFDIQADYTTLKDFKVDVRNVTTKGIEESGTAITTPGLELSPGEIGNDVQANLGQAYNPSGIEVRVTSNCFNVRTEWAVPI